MEITPARALGGAGLPVCLVLEPKPAALRVVALTVLDRLMVTFHRAGASRIVVVTGGEELPDIRRARALGIPFEVMETMPAMDGRVVLSGTGWWGPREEVEQGMSGATGRWTSDDGEPLGAGVLEGGSPGGLRGLEAMPGIRIGRRSSRVRDAAEARRAEDRLWSGLSSGADGMVDRWFNRPVGRWALSRWLVSTGVSPNHVSLAATAMGLAAAGLFGVPGTGHAMAASVLFQASAVVDCVDGDIARAVFKESRLGKWIDLVGDQVVHGAVFAGIATGLSGGRLGYGAWVLGGLAVWGALASFGAVLRGMRRPGTASGWMKRWIDGATNRDFSVLVMVLAFAGRLEWFLWMAAIGGNVFWMLVLWEQGQRAGGGGGRGKAGA